MRLSRMACLLLILSGFCLAQDTNFSTGPQYLMNFGSPLFLQPITTPSLSLSAPAAPIPAPVPAAPAENNAETVTTPPATQIHTDLPDIYWGERTSGNPAENVSEIELSSHQPASLPSDFVHVGVWQMVDAQALEAAGYDISLGQAAEYWKAHKTPVPHVYSNADIARLHKG